MKSFLVFSGHRYYPGPAWTDMRGICPTLAAAETLLVACNEYGLDWYQIVDVEAMAVVQSGTFAGPDEFGEDGWRFSPDDRQEWCRYLERFHQAAPSSPHT